VWKSFLNEILVHVTHTALARPDQDNGLNQHESNQILLSNYIRRQEEAIFSNLVNFSMRDTLGSCGSHKATPLEATPSHPMSKLEHVPASNFHITIQPKVGLVIYEVLGGGWPRFFLAFLEIWGWSAAGSVAWQFVFNHSDGGSGTRFLRLFPCDCNLTRALPRREWPVTNSNSNGLRNELRGARAVRFWLSEPKGVHRVSRPMHLLGVDGKKCELVWG